MYIQIGVQDVHPISLYIINILWKDQPIKKKQQSTLLPLFDSNEKCVRYIVLLICLSVCLKKTLCIPFHPQSD